MMPAVKMVAARSILHGQLSSLSVIPAWGLDDSRMHQVMKRVDIPEVIIPVLRSHDLVLEDGVDARWCLLTSGSKV